MTNNKIHLYGDYFLKEDHKGKHLNYIITVRTITKGSEKFRDIWFYGNLNQLLVGIQEHFIKENYWSKDLEHVVMELERLREVVYGLSEA